MAYLTHWGRVTHIYKLTIIGSDNGLSPGRRQAITWTNVGILLIGPLGTNFNETSIEIHTFSFKKIHLKLSSGKWRPFCLGLNVLSYDSHIIYILNGWSCVSHNSNCPMHSSNVMCASAHLCLTSIHVAVRLTLLQVLVVKPEYFRWELGQHHGCWWPGYLHHQEIHHVYMSSIPHLVVFWVLVSGARFDPHGLVGTVACPWTLPTGWLQYCGIFSMG